MSLPELDERFDEIVLELRATQVVASSELRERVRALAASPPPPQARRRVRRRWLVVGLAPAAAALAVGGALVAGLFSAPSPQQRPEKLAAAPAQTAPQQENFGAAETGERGSALQTTLAPATLAPTRERAQQYTADLRLRVRNLSRATKQALAITRALGGYVRSVDYADGRSAGTAELVVRVPLRAVQTAIVRLSALGAILNQQVDVQDVQSQLDARFRRLQALRREITKLQAARPDAARERKLAHLRAQLRALQREQAQAIRRTSFATVALGLTTKKPVAAAPPKPSRFDHALDRAGRILLDETVVLVYVLVVGGPIAVLAALFVLGGRSLRRRGEARLLERS